MVVIGLGNRDFTGKVQVYCGAGKGKTTAALGLGLRAIGQGLRVKMVQFLKGQTTGERIGVERLAPDFQILRFYEMKSFFWTMSKSEQQVFILENQAAWKQVEELVQAKEMDILILDEVLGLVENEVLTVSDLQEFIRKKPKDLELVLTGRKLPPELLDEADLITEMREVKHYFQIGVPARAGIEF